MATQSESPVPTAGTGRYRVNRAIFDMVRDPDRRRLVEDKPPFLARYQLEPAERAALEAPDWPKLLELGALPNLIFKYYLLHGLTLGDLAATMTAKPARSGGR